MYAEQSVDGRSDRSVIIVLAVVAILAPLLTAGATAFYFTNHEQDQTISDLRREIDELRAANDRLFGELASSTAAERAVAAEAARLKSRLASLERELRGTKGELAAARRALRAQARAFRRAQEEARTSSVSPAPAAAPAPRTVQFVRDRSLSLARSPLLFSAAPPAPPPPSPPAPPSVAPEQPPPVAEAPKEEGPKQGIRGRGWGR